ncbi:MAG: extracellular solute-binding protein [Lachnospiraceae bacterium]|nr:extracellular solute-binding protein [Lachnospiraceae bacterium]
MSTVMNGCSKKEQTALQEEIKVPIMFLVNPDTGENENEKLVEAFNAKYDGTYEIQVEWIIDTAEGYRSRIKTLNVVDKLPAVITDVGFDADFYELLVQNNRLVNLDPYLREDPQWKEALGEREIDSMRESDGSVYLSSSGNSTMSYGGFYYNKKIFADAGIDQFPGTWEEFFSCMDKLQENKVTPLALHGGSGYWTPLLISSGYIVQTEEGKKFLEEQYPLNYQSESSVEFFSFLKRLYSYGASDAVEIERTEAAKRFLEGKEAITANGGWMIDSMTDEEKRQFGFASFPGNVLMQDMKMSAWSVTAGYSPEVTKGALEFLRFRALSEQKQEETYLSLPAETVVEQEYRQAVRQVKTLYPNYQLKWEDTIQEKFLVDMLPSYIKGEIDEKTFLQALTAEAVAVHEEK